MSFKWLLIGLLLLAAAVVYYHNEIPRMSEPTIGKELEQLEQKPKPIGVRRTAPGQSHN